VNWLVYIAISALTYQLKYRLHHSYHKDSQL